ncbi:MAG: DegT/DnrJ/EryC1/StrS family aminotransferase [Chloroflexi bacterium]|nr:DegT/DnrJ/EryC1/StrS family aminotransferase [Chloroflexota bacterium]
MVSEFWRTPCCSKSSRGPTRREKRRSGSEALIPVNEPLLGEREVEMVVAALRSGWISGSGPHIEAFERAWAEYCGRKHGIAVANGTVALHLAIAVLDLQPGDEVIMPTFTIISCATPVVLAGARPVLVDSDPRTWTMDVNQVEAKITSRTRALMPVHIYGHPVDMEPLLALAGRDGLTVIEDAAEAHGAEYRGQRCGSFGTVSTFSFYANKLVTTGEGGMLLVDDDGLAERAARLRNLGFQPGRRFLHDELGFNYRLTNLQAALGLAQLERMDEIVARKRAIGHAYTQRLSELPGVQLQVQQPWARGVYWMFGLVLDETTRLDAATFAQRLLERGVETRPFFLGMHEQPVLRARGFFDGESYPVAERIARQGLYLPSGLALQESDIDRVCEAVREVLA